MGICIKIPREPFYGLFFYGIFNVLDSLYYHGFEDAGIRSLRTTYFFFFFEVLGKCPRRAFLLSCSCSLKKKKFFFGALVGLGNLKKMINDLYLVLRVPTWEISFWRGGY